MPGLALACSALSGLAAIDRLDRALDRAGVGHLAQAARLDERARIGALVGTEQHGEQVLGDLAGDDAFADQVDQRRQRAAAQSGLGDRQNSGRLRRPTGRP